jgi:hypothetical protein
MPKTFADYWNEYRELVYPKYDEHQLREIRRSFYAGVVAWNTATLRAVGKDAPTVRSIRAMLNEIDQVMFEYIASDRSKDENGVPIKEEERRFYRLIEEREMNKDGTQEITLACGHATIQIIPLPETQQYSLCAECVRLWVKAELTKQSSGSSTQ